MRLDAAGCGWMRRAGPVAADWARVLHRSTARRALAQGLARNQGRFLGKAAEETEAGKRPRVLHGDAWGAAAACMQQCSPPLPWTFPCLRLASQPAPPLPRRPAAPGCGRGAVPHRQAPQRVCARCVCCGGGGQAAEVGWWRLEEGSREGRQCEEHALNAAAAGAWASHDMTWGHGACIHARAGSLLHVRRAGSLLHMRPPAPPTHMPIHPAPLQLLQAHHGAHVLGWRWVGGGCGACLWLALSHAAPLACLRARHRISSPPLLPSHPPHPPEPELLVLSQMLHVPILVYIPSQEAGRCSSGGAGGTASALPRLHPCMHACPRPPPSPFTIAPLRLQGRRRWARLRVHPKVRRAVGQDQGRQAAAPCAPAVQRRQPLRPAGCMITGVRGSTLLLTCSDLPYASRGQACSSACPLHEVVCRDFPRYTARMARYKEDR